MKKDEKTKERLANELVELLQKKPLDLISVKELTTLAHVSRTAFYNNFEKIEDVLKYVYRKAHQKHFKDKYKDYHYFHSDDYIYDMIEFFDQNTKLLRALFKWQIIDLIAKYNTNIVLNYVQNYENPLLRDNAFYYTCFTGVTYFNICGVWIIDNKQKSKGELFNLIKYFMNL